MKLAILIFSVALFTLIGCNQQTIKRNHFSALQDTLLIKMQQNPGKGFSKKLRAVSKLRFEDSLEYDVILPEKIENIQLASEIADYSRIDTTNILSRKDNSICFLQGVLNGEDVFIVDENFNKDFRDDSIRAKKMEDFYSDDDLIKCDFKIFEGKENVMISNWIQVGKWKFGNNELYYSTKQNYTADFILEESSYSLEYFISDARFNFNEPTFSLITFDGVQVDTITDGELLSIDDYLRLKEGDYRIHKLSNDGTQLTLVKDNSFEKLYGTQIGMLAPTFNCISMMGDSIDFKNYKGKLLLLANVSACYSTVSSYQCYKDLTIAYGQKMKILCLDKSPVALENNIKKLNLTGNFIDVNKNEELKKYRSEFCSRTCYLINVEGRIIDNFEIFDWKQSLSKHFEIKK